MHGPRGGEVIAQLRQGGVTLEARLPALKARKTERMVGDPVVVTFAGFFGRHTHAAAINDVTFVVFSEFRQ